MASPGLVVFDEAQSWPALFSRLRGAIDADRSRTGRFLILGSVTPGLMRAVAESLAGRIALLELDPLLASEVPELPTSELWLRGGLPPVTLEPARFPAWSRDYLQNLVQRDLPLWGNGTQLRGALAFRIGDPAAVVAAWTFHIPASRLVQVRVLRTLLDRPRLLSAGALGH